MNTPPDDPFDFVAYLDEQIDKLRQQVASGDEAAAAQLRALEGRLDEYDAAALPDLDTAETPPPRFSSVEAWVTGYFVQCYVRPTGGEWRWCPRWWDHAEAISRLEALWRSWEALTCDPALGMATWLTQHLDPQLPVLMGNRGPFARCSDDRHEPSKPLRSEPAPAGWWRMQPPDSSGTPSQEPAHADRPGVGG
jgi:hypothetical protein